MKKYKIYPLPAGVNADPMDKSMLVFRFPIGTGVPLPNGSFAVRGDSEWILVDAGMPGNDEIVKFGKPPLRKDMPYAEVLKSRGIVPEEIKTIVLTHLHWDHAWNLDLFPNARIYVQEKELFQSVHPYPHEYTQYGYMGVRGYENPPFLRHIHQMEVISGEYELRDGILLVSTPGHTHGSQSVLVDTEEGKYAIMGDFCFLQENWEKGIMIGTYCSYREWYDSYELMKTKQIDHVLLTHDETSYSRKVYG